MTNISTFCPALFAALGVAACGLGTVGPLSQLDDGPNHPTDVSANPRPEEVSGAPPSVSQEEEPDEALTEPSPPPSEDPPPSSDPGQDTPPATSTVTVRGRQLLVNGQPFTIKGVCWNPVPQGGNHPADLDYAGFVKQDARLMRQAGINAVRTYEPLTDQAVLDQLYAAGIYVLNTVYAWGGADIGEVVGRVQAAQGHPAILMWSLGNEWNYNGLYVGVPHDEALARLNEGARLIRSVDPETPIATVYGELPSREVIEAMPDIDLWGLNVYRGISFGNLFEDWAARSDKPMFFAEYGADAWNANINGADPEAQGRAVAALTQLILDHASATSPSAPCVGGTVFEWVEEWWGILDIDRNPRPAYRELQRLFLN